MNKKNIVILISAAAIFTTLLFGFTTKTKSEKGIITMRTSEWTANSAGNFDNSIIIIYEDGTKEKVELSKLKLGDLSTNLTKINENLNKLVSKGYKLLSTAGTGSEFVFITTYTFVQE